MAVFGLNGYKQRRHCGVFPGLLRLTRGIEPVEDGLSFIDARLVEGDIMTKRKRASKASIAKHNWYGIITALVSAVLYLGARALPFASALTSRSSTTTRTDSDSQPCSHYLLIRNSTFTDNGTAIKTGGDPCILTDRNSFDGNSTAVDAGSTGSSTKIEKAK